MKTHEFAKALESLAKLLRSSPNSAIDWHDPDPLRLSGRPSNAEIAVNIHTLAAMAQIGKQEWRDFVREYDLPIDIRARDASRDIVGKVLRYLDENPHEQSKIAKSASMRSPTGSPELLKAFSIFLRAEDGDRE